MNYRSAVLAVALTLGAFLPSASAQDHEEARTIFEEASRQFEAGNHLLALQGFLQSRELMADDARASALLLFNIARAQEELQRYADALATFEEYLVAAPRDAPFREETQDRVRELRARVEATTPRRDDQPAAIEPETSSPLPVVGGITLAAGVAVGLVALIPGVLALDGASGLEAAWPGGECPVAEASRIEETHTLGVVTDVLWISGAVVAAAGAVLLGVGVASARSSESAAMSPSIGCGPNGCIVGVAGRY
jgi:tetratricopeptide (TPR) repeat protein